MKKLIIMIVFFSPLVSFSQEKIKGIIETEGHVFKNDTLKNPFTVKYDLYGVEIVKDKEQFERQRCHVENCKIIHLKKKMLMGAYVIRNNQLTVTTH